MKHYVALKKYYWRNEKRISIDTFSYSNSNQNSSLCLCMLNACICTFVPSFTELGKRKNNVFPVSFARFTIWSYNLKATNHRLWHEYLEFQEQTKSRSKPMTRNWVSFRQFVDGLFRSCWLLSCFYVIFIELISNYPMMTIRNGRPTNYSIRLT